jgi:sigma-B regulation protein RsbU (phosphoserine phosphatase)
MGNMTSFQELIMIYGNIFFDLFEYVCTLLIIFYILFQTGVIQRVLRTSNKWKAARGTVIMIILFGALGIIASVKAFPIGGGVLANVRDLPIAIAGMLGGPIAGIGAGIIAGFYRLLLGGNTAFAGALMAFLAGIAGGVTFICMQKKFIRPLFAAVYALVFELFHMLAVLLTSSGPDPLKEVQQLIIPMVTANTFGLFMFSFMVHRAMNYMTIKTKKDKIEAELQTAHAIQINMLPRIFPPFPERKDIDIYAYMRPAKEVCGDFYDFFLVDNNKICAIIGDVSDKGVPAALFMTIIKTLLKTEALRSSALNDVLKRVNDILYPDNESSSFATVFCAVLDTDTGEIAFANGGHLPPIVCSGGVSAEFIPIDTNSIVGCMPEVTFTQQSMRIRPGETLFLYTDGVTEANNLQMEMFSRDRLIDALKKACTQKGDMKMFVHSVVGEIDAFSGDAEQYDDITILALHYKGKE